MEKESFFIRNPKQSITFKVIFGYLLLALLIGFAAWLIYPQVRAFVYPAKEKESANRKLTYISNALSLLYEAETVGRSAMATGDTDQFSRYRAYTDSIVVQIDSLTRITETPAQTSQLDSIKISLKQKTENMNAMVTLRKEQFTRDFYAEAVEELNKKDIYFEDYANDPKLESVNPRVKRAIVDYMEYIRRDNIEADQNMNSMAEKVKEVMTKLGRRQKILEMRIIKREDILFTNDRNISQKIRNLLVALEREGTLSAQDRERELRSKIGDVSQTLKIIGAVSILLALGFVVMVFRDASRSQRYSLQLEKSNTVARSLLKSREQLMATITHDMRSPLNTVIGFTELLQKTDLNGKQENYLNHVEKSSEYILRLVNDLLDFSKLESGRVNIEQVTFNAKNLVEDIAVVGLPTVIKDDLKINMALSKELDGYFMSDPFRIKQIVSNLISNAYKFTDHGSVNIRSGIEEKADVKSLFFEITDTGIGINKEKQEIIFKEFTQEDERIEQTYGGFGLGLAITKRLVDLLNGTITLTSEKGKGSTFLVHIPVKEVKGYAKEIPEQFAPEKRPERILIVDDDPAQLNLAKEIVNNLSIKNDTARNGIEALQLIEKNNYDLILTDIQMPEMDGIDLIKALREKSKYNEVPIYALSGNGSLKPSDYKQLGFSGSLKKPYLPQKLLRLITHNESEAQAESKAVSKTPVDPIKGYTLEDLKLFADQDPDSLQSILNVFVESTADSIADLNRALENKKCDEINKIAHKMLPMFRQLRAQEIITILEKLESPELPCTSKVVLRSLGRVVNQKIDKMLLNLKEEIKDLYHSV
ncbi:ATP-binding protein [Flavimarina sp. Hel_I_48]|uniref:ATP-binding protein n=1 Tax=Flavimarina sp. Hel_I_48 TaxID=1392488 RepID=UPI00068968BF|nr:ATP-binding protein [Flavimarina sp. Hel_I_48]